MALFRKSYRRVVREASEWALRLERDQSEASMEAFRRWRDSDPRHGETFAEMAEIASVAGRVSPRSEAARLGPVPINAARTATRLAYAASFAMAVLLLSALALGPRWFAERELERLAFATAVGEIRGIDLPDGSRLVLDSASRLEAEFGRHGRSLALLEGRARFRVAHEPRPFLVRAGPSEVVATGTLFDVSLIGGRTTVVLLEGSVEVRRASARGGAGERLRPGQKLVAAAGSPPVRRPAARGETRWPMRMLEFDRTPLAEAVSLANRYSRIRIVLGDDRVGALRISGAFRAGDTPGLARSLAAAFDLRVQTQADGSFVLTSRNLGRR